MSRSEQSLIGAGAALQPQRPLRLNSRRTQFEDNRVGFSPISRHSSRHRGWQLRANKRRSWPTQDRADRHRLRGTGRRLTIGNTLLEIVPVSDFRWNLWVAPSFEYAP